MDDPQEDANLGLDARRFLGFKAHDEEVRAALGRLPREYLYPWAGLNALECVEGLFPEVRSRGSSEVSLERFKPGPFGGYAPPRRVRH